MLFLAISFLFPGLLAAIRCYSGFSTSQVAPSDQVGDSCARYSIPCSMAGLCNGFPPTTIIQYYLAANKTSVLDMAKSGSVASYDDVYLCDTPLCNTPTATSNNLFPTLKKLGCFVNDKEGKLSRMQFYTDTAGDVGCIKMGSQQSTSYSAMKRENFVKTIGSLPLEGKKVYSTFLYCTTDFCNSAEASGITDENLWGSLLPAPTIPTTTSSPSASPSTTNIKVNASTQSKTPNLILTLIAILVSVGFTGHILSF